MSSDGKDETTSSNNNEIVNIDESSIPLTTTSGDSRVNLLPVQNKWSPSGSRWRDLLHFVGPGWLVSIAYVDPGNYQADIQAGSESRYQLLWVVWWTSILSIYVQILCVRLAYYTDMTLAEAQARYNSRWMRYLNWFIAEFSTIITDLPEVIGIGIACNIFFGWPYYVGVLCSLLTTMVFLLTLNYGTRLLEFLVFVFVGIMSVALFIEMDYVKPNSGEIMKGWIYGFATLSGDDVFAITGIIGAVVMPHNLYLHTAAIRSRPVEKGHLKEAVYYSSWEPVLPIFISFFVNLAIVAIAAEKVFGSEFAGSVGLTDFCSYFEALPGGCTLWAIALLAAGQSSAITTTYTGQYVMDGFLQLQIPIKMRAVVTRLVAITPCIIVSTAFPNQLNELVNIVNSLLSFLLPFAFTPLVKFNCSPQIMGEEGCAKNREKYILYLFAFAVYAINAQALSAKGGGFFGDLRDKASDGAQVAILIPEITIQVLYFWWNYNCIMTPIAEVGSGATDEANESAISNDDVDFL